MNIQTSKYIQKIPEPFLQDLLQIFRIFQQNQFQIYLIGGSVRDLLMDKIPKEYDLTTSATPEQVKSLFKKVIETGIKHGTVTVLIKDRSYEITTFRRDLDYVDGRRPEKVEYGVSLSEDLMRRDFTMNAIGLDLIGQNLIDEHNGISDIQNQIIRTIGDSVHRFTEDGLRPIRAIRFHSTLEFKIESNTYQAIYRTRSITEKISTERFHDELIKILLSNRASQGIELLYTNDIFELFLKTQFQKKLSDLSNIDKLAKSPLSLRLAYLVYLFHSDREDYYKTSEATLKALKFSNREVKESLFFIGLFQNQFNVESVYEWKKILSSFLVLVLPTELDIFLEAYFSYLCLSHSSKIISKLKSTTNAIFQNKEPLKLSDIQIDGNQIISHFPHIEKKNISKMLEHLLDILLKNPEKNQLDILLSECRNFDFS